VLALALVVRESLEERGQVGILAVGLERDGPAALELLEMALLARHALVLGRGLL
jgi:hypothetical protein